MKQVMDLVIYVFIYCFACSELAEFGKALQCALGDAWLCEPVHLLCFRSTVLDIHFANLADYQVHVKLCLPRHLVKTKINPYLCLQRRRDRLNFSFIHLFWNFPHMHTSQNPLCGEVSCNFVTTRDFTMTSEALFYYFRIDFGIFYIDSE